MKQAACIAALLFFAAVNAERHALLVGVDEYQDRDGISRLSGAENDVDGLASALLESAGFSSPNVQVLKGSQATKLAIVQALEKLSSRVQADDIVFFSFSGHGFQPGERAFLVPYDALGGSDGVLQNSSLPAEEVARLLSKVNAGLIVASFDMCRNSPLTGGERSNGYNTFTGRMARDLTITASNRVGSPRRAITLFASSAGERSWEDPGRKRGFFSWRLEQGLRGQAAREDGSLTLSSLIEYLERTVPQDVRQSREAKQNPTIRWSGANTLGFEILRTANLERPPKEADWLIAESFRLIQAASITPGNSSKALRFAKAALALDPKRVDANEAASLAALFDRELAEAERYARFAVSANKVSSSSQGILALVLEAKYWAILQMKASPWPPKDVAAEIDRLYNVLSSRKDVDPQNLVNWALYLQRQGDFPRARELSKRVLAIAPNHATGHLLLGATTWSLHKKLGDAEASIRRSIEIDPGFSDAYSYLYGFLVENKRSPSEAAELKALAELNGITVGTEYGLDESLGRGLITLDPTRPEGYNKLAQLYKKLGRTADLEKLRAEAARNGVTIDP